MDRDYYRYPFEISNAWKRCTTWIITTTIVMFIIQLISVKWIGFNITYYLGLTPATVVENMYGWQLVTYIFLHDPVYIWHIIFNMLFLYFFGRDLEEIYSKWKFLFLYFGGGIFAGLIYTIVEYFHIRSAPCVGASGALMAIAVACAFHWPNRVVIFIIFPIKLKHLVLLFIAVDIISCLMTPTAGRVAYVAHLAGVFFGFLFFKFYDTSFESINSLFRIHHLLKKKREEEFEKRIDEILEKVSKKGMANLSKKEKRLLFEASKRKKQKL